jgi:cellulose synthase/poly-beta-1,6-N-acetylglucosamine synthase-like glycosyltransferase
MTKGCMGTKGSMDQRTKPLCSPVTCIFTNSLPLVFFFFLLLCSFFFLFSLFFLLFFCSSLLLFFLYSLLSFLSFLIFCSLCPAPVRSLEGLIYSLNISLFRKDSMH